MIQLLSQNNRVQFDSDSVLPVLFGTGSVTVPATGNSRTYASDGGVSYIDYTLQLPFYLLNPIIYLRAPINVWIGIRSIYSYIGDQSFPPSISLLMKVPPSITLDYKVYSTVNNPPQRLSGYGIQTFDAQGELLYQDDFRLLQLKTAKLILSEGQFMGAVHTPTFHSEPTIVAEDGGRAFTFASHLMLNERSQGGNGAGGFYRCLSVRNVTGGFETRCMDLLPYTNAMTNQLSGRPRYTYRSI